MSHAENRIGSAIMTDAAFTQALTAAQPRLLRYARGIAFRKEDVEDLLQETLFRAWRGRESYEGTASVYTWCGSVMRNVAAEFGRKSLTHPQHSIFCKQVDDYHHIPAPEVDLVRMVDDQRAMKQVKRFFIRFPLVLKDGVSQYLDENFRKDDTAKTHRLRAVRQLRVMLTPKPKGGLFERKINAPRAGV